MNFEFFSTLLIKINYFYGQFTKFNIIFHFINKKREQDILKDSSQVTHKLFYVWFYISHISSCEPSPLERLIQNFQRLYNKTSYFYKTEWMCGKIYAFPTQNHRCSDGG